MGVKKQKKESPPKLWMNSFGLFLLVKPPAVGETWRSSIGTVGGVSKEYTHFECNIHGKVRVLSNHAFTDTKFKEIASTRVSGTNLYETVLMDIEFSKFDLESNPSADVLELEDIVPDYSEGKILQTIGRSISSTIKKEIPWRSSQLSKMVMNSSLSLIDNSVYCFSYAFLIVDDFNKFYRLVSDELVSEGVSHQTHNFPFAQQVYWGVLELRLRTPIEKIPIANIEFETAPVYLWILEKEKLGHFMFSTPIGDMQGDKRVHHVVQDSRTQKNHSLQINRMRMIRDTLAWAGGECTRILEFLPVGFIDSELHLENRTKTHLKSWESLSIVRGTQLLLQDFVIHEDPIEVPTGYYNPNLRKDRIEQRLSVLNQRLDSLERTVQTRLRFDREELQTKNQEKFNKATIALGVMVLFEIVATYLAWFYPQGNPIGHLAWLVLIIALSIMIFRIAEVTLQPESEVGRNEQKANETNETVRIVCPYCAATYSYDAEKQEITCQNCNKLFQQPQ
jgi:hypothetical protein